MFVHCCHCRWCQRETGSAFALNAMIEADQVETVDGRAVATTIPTKSGNGQTIHRCPSCQIAVWSTYGGLGERVVLLRAGTLDNPDLMPPDIHIYARSKQPWVTHAGDIPVVDEFYKRSDYWPQSSIDRLAQMRKEMVK